MKIEQLQNRYQTEIENIREDVKRINVELAEARAEKNESLREILREDRRELQIREQCLIQVIHDLDDLTQDNN